jgi:hypothetical protein
MKRFFNRVRPNDNLLTTRWLDITAAGTWLLYSIYGISTFLQKLGSFKTLGAPYWYSTGWSCGIAISAGVAGLAAAWIFHDDRFPLLKKKRLERDALLVFIAFLIVEFSLLTGLVVMGHAIMTFPSFRIGHLNRRIRLLLKAPVS